MIVFKVALLPSVEIELDEIFNWYEKQRSGLGFEFLNCFDAAVARIKNNPFHTFNVNETIRRVITDRFPYVVYYSIHPEDNLILIRAVLHQSKNRSGYYTNR